MGERASYDLKLDRAEHHLVDIKSALDRYADRHPYTVSTRVEGKKNRVVRRFEFTEHPGPEVGVLVGEFIYNVRSALDHLRAALAGPGRERDGYFPIYFEGVWEPPVEGENKERTKERSRWLSDVDGMLPEAIAILQRMQAYAASTELDPPALTAINRIAMKDRHSKLPVLGACLLEPRITCTMPDGRVQHLGPSANEIAVGDYASDGAQLFSIPDDAVDVKIKGTPKAMVRISSPESGVRIPDVLSEVILPGSREVVDALRPYVQTAG